MSHEIFGTLFHLIWQPYLGVVQRIAGDARKDSIWKYWCLWGGSLYQGSLWGCSCALKTAPSSLP